MTRQLTFSLAEPHAKASQSQDSGRDLKTQEGTSHSPLLQWLNDLNPNGLSGKMSPVSCQVIEDGILVPSYLPWGTSGMGGPTESWTLNTSEFHKDADVCLLSDVLEIGEVHQKFFLSPKACRGILRRAERRSKELPQKLLKALRSVAQKSSK